MLVIISDLHLTDGTSGTSLPPGAFQIFAERLQDVAERASHRAGGVYAPIEQIDLVLLGDVLDAIRSNIWLDDSVRPWDDPQSPEMIDVVRRITQATLENNAEALRVLRLIGRESAIEVPTAMRNGRPSTDELTPVPVRIHYMVGNHDWFYHLPGPEYDAIRRSVVESMGLAHPHDRPFPHDPQESEPLLEAMRRHRVLARHGDIYDPFNFEQDRDASSLGDAIVIDLVNRFSREVEQELATDLPPGVLLGMREIDNIRPLLLIPVWIDGLLERSCPTPAVRKAVKQIWDRMADDFLSLDFVRQRDTWSPIDLVDGLERALKFTKRLSLGWASAITNWLQQLRGSRDESYWKHALSEQEFRNRRARAVVYGHTHYPETVPLDSSFDQGAVNNQVYFNSGTWRRLHRQTMYAVQEHEFIASDTMTYLAFFQGDERGGRPYESWSGTLGVNLPDAASLRIDAAHAQLAGPRQAPRPHVSSPTIHGGPADDHAAADRSLVVPSRRLR